LTDPSSSSPDSEGDPKSEEDAPALDGALEALFSEALELQHERKKAEDKEGLEAMIAENYGREPGEASPGEDLSDADEGLALPDLPEDEREETPAGIDPATVERLESELEMLKQQKKTLHQQMAQRAGRFENAEQRIVQLEQQLVATNRRGQGVTRDFELFRTRTEREREQQKTMATSRLLKSFLTVYDNLTRALEHAEHTDGPLGQGVDMTLKQFLAILEHNGATVVSSEIGAPFDPTYHEAMQQTYSEELPEGTIAGVLLVGFMLGDRLLRAATVTVSQGPDPANKSVRKKGASAKKQVAKSKKSKRTTAKKKSTAAKPKTKKAKKNSKKNS
jgi:molecular chaperone GrpE